MRWPPQLRPRPHSCAQYHHMCINTGLKISRSTSFIPVHKRFLSGDSGAWIPFRFNLTEENSTSNPKLRVKVHNCSPSVLLIVPLYMKKSNRQAVHAIFVGSTITDLGSSKHSPTVVDEVKLIYDDLKSIGLPEAIAFADFRQLIQGKSEKRDIFGQGKGKTTVSVSKATDQEEGTKLTIYDALRFLHAHIVGREDVYKARQIIYRARKEYSDGMEKARPLSRIKTPSVYIQSGKSENALQDARIKALSRLEMAYRALQTAKKEYEGGRVQVESLDKQKRRLEVGVAQKRRVKFLLEVLESREAIRVERLEGRAGVGSGIGSQVYAQREESANAMSEFSRVLRETSVSLSRAPSNMRIIPSHLTVSVKTLRYQHTVEALAGLYARHIRVRRLNGNGKKEVEKPEVQMKRRLETVLSRLSFCEHGELDKAIQKIRLLAAQRAKNRRKTFFGVSTVTESELEEASRAVAAKTSLFQEKIQKAAALNWICENHVDLIATFRTETAPVLEDVLEEESRRVNGYIDRLRSGINSSMGDTSVASRNPEANSFSAKVRAILDSTQLGSAEEVANSLKRAAQIDVLRARTLVVPAEVIESDVEQSKLDVDAILDTTRCQWVLERKSAKADHGRVVAEDVRTLLGEIKRLR